LWDAYDDYKGSSFKQIEERKKARRPTSYGNTIKAGSRADITSKAHTAITALQNQAIASTLDRVEVEVIGADEGMARWPSGAIGDTDRSYKTIAESPAPSHHQYTEGAEVSRATAKVKISHGTIKYGIYNGTVDFYWSPLFDMSDEAWQAWTSIAP